MVYVALVLFTLAVVALGAWAGRTPAQTAPAPPCSSDRLGIRAAPSGPATGL